MGNTHEKPNFSFPRSFTPVPVYTRDARLQQGPRATLWQRFDHWIRYYSIQTRWDIERFFARLLHRPWRARR